MKARKWGARLLQEESGTSYFEEKKAKMKIRVRFELRYGYLNRIYFTTIVIHSGSASVHFQRYFSVYCAGTRRVKSSVVMLRYFYLTCRSSATRQQNKTTIPFG